VKALWIERYGVPGFVEIDTRDMAPAGSPGPFIKFALGYRESVMIELIEPDASDAGIYGDALRADGGTMLHHLGYLLDANRFDEVKAAYTAHGTPVPVLMQQPGGMPLLYADTRPESGMFSEVVVLTDAMRQIFDQIPR
jgi:hypothetical protein